MPWWGWLLVVLGGIVAVYWLLGLAMVLAVGWSIFRGTPKPAKRKRRNAKR